MAAVFLKLLNMSITAGWLILAVIVLRLVLKKAPKWTRCALWGLVGLRLVLPFSIESALSLIPSAETVPQTLITGNGFDVDTGIGVIDSQVNNYIGDHYYEGVTVPTDTGADIMTILVWIWLAGIAAMLIYTAISYFRLRRKVDTAVLLRGNIWQSENVKSPFILGMFRPRIYLPFNMTDEDMTNVLAHENAHLKRRDHLIKPLAFLLLTVYWFNPLIWLAYVLLCRDIELACDERVVKGLGEQERRDYGAALLSCSVSRKSIAACPLAFGEVGLKERIKTMLNYRKPAFWIIVVAGVACIVVAVCFLTNPKTADNENYSAQIQAAYPSALQVGSIGDVTIPDKLSEETAYAVPSAEGTSLEIVFPVQDTAFSISVMFSRETPQDEWVMLPEIIANQSTLSLNDVIILSQKGEDLTWSDFDGYSYAETGSGLYIRVYEINELFSLWIGGGSIEESPMYIRLVSETNQDDYIDIRTENVTAFLEKHSSSISDTGFAYETTYAWAGYSEDGYNAMVERAENRDTERRYGNVSHLTPVVKLDSKSDYDAFYEEMSAYFDLTSGYDEVGAFSAQSGEYSNDFFAENALFIAYLEEVTTSNRHEVEEVRIENGTLEIRICCLSPDEKDTAMAGWFITVAVPKSDIADCTGYDAYICSTVYTDQTFPTGELIRSYCSAGKDTSQSAVVSLYDSGEFTFSFSPISSYLGHGTYTIDNDRLTLNTYDGNYTYVFDMVDDTLVFDAGDSSDMVWYSGLVNGSVLQ